MPVGFSVPSDNDEPTSDITLNSYEDDALCEHLGTQSLSKRLIAARGVAIVFDQDAAEEGKSLNSRATDLLWRYAPSTYLSLFIHGDALVLGYAGDDEYRDPPSHVREAVESSVSSPEDSFLPHLRAL